MLDPRMIGRPQPGLAAFQHEAGAFGRALHGGLGGKIGVDAARARFGGEFRADLPRRLPHGVAPAVEMIGRPLPCRGHCIHKGADAGGGGQCGLMDAPELHGIGVNLHDLGRLGEESAGAPRHEQAEARAQHQDEIGRLALRRGDGNGAGIMGIGRIVGVEQAHGAAGLHHRNAQPVAESRDLRLSRLITRQRAQNGHGAFRLAQQAQHLIDMLGQRRGREGGTGSGRASGRRAGAPSHRWAARRRPGRGAHPTRP
jgi:hypothetical protein